jgi:tRNA A37 methylthiotransferase MiaB
MIDTDIGDDIDDAFALLLAMKLNFEIVGITTVFENTDQRARIAKKLLKSQKERMKREQKKLIGSQLQAIFDYVDDESGYGVARTFADAPDIDNVLYFEVDDTVQPGDFITVEITGIASTDLIGKLLY